MKSELVKPTHLARKAVVYIRQSTPHQVVSNQESLRLQYALRERARELGWHEADIDVIDADLGLSGASAAQRGGFKELVGRVGLDEVGLILSLDVTRLARNCSDWYPLLDICGLRGCLIADRDGVYDPGSANGRLLLGLKGTISELELHTIRSRLTAGLLAKAERGELAHLSGVIGVGDTAWTQAVAKREADVVARHQCANLGESGVEEVLFVVVKAPFGHDRAAAADDAGHPAGRHRHVAKQHSGMNREVVDAL